MTFLMSRKLSSSLYELNFLMAENKKHLMFE
jgi:hypothetical protein